MERFRAVKTEVKAEVEISLKQRKFPKIWPENFLAHFLFY